MRQHIARYVCMGWSGNTCASYLILSLGFLILQNHFESRRWVCYDKCVISMIIESVCGTSLKVLKPGQL